jgi:hypothetical protein
MLRHQAKELMMKFSRGFIRAAVASPMLFCGIALHSAQDIDGKGAVQELTQDEIIVLGKLNVAKIKFKLRNEKLSCKIVKGTGNKKIDNLACAAVYNCFEKTKVFDRSTLDCVPQERIRLVKEFSASQRK